MDAKLEMAVKMAVIRSKRTLKTLLPRDTGNLQDNAFIVRYTPGGLEIYIDELIAPYAKYPHIKRKIDAVWPIIVKRFAQDIATAINGQVE